MRPQINTDENCFARSLQDWGYTTKPAWAGYKIKGIKTGICKVNTSLMMLR